MDIVIPRLTAPVSLSDYAPEFEGVTVYVWINPPRDAMKNYFALSDEHKSTLDTINDPATSGADLKKAITQLAKISDGIIAWWVELWSQHRDPETHWTVDGVTALINSDTDPALYGWLCGQSLNFITEHRAKSKKK